MMRPRVEDTHVRPDYSLPSEDPNFKVVWAWDERRISNQILRAYGRVSREDEFAIDANSIVYELEAYSMDGESIQKVLSSEQADRWVMIDIMEYARREADKRGEKIIDMLEKIDEHQKDKTFRRA